MSSIGNITPLLLRSAVTSGTISAALVLLDFYQWSSPEAYDVSQLPVSKIVAMSIFSFFGSFFVITMMDWISKGYTTSALHMESQCNMARTTSSLPRTFRSGIGPLWEEEENAQGQELDRVLHFLDSSLAFPQTPVPPNSPRRKRRARSRDQEMSARSLEDTSRRAHCETGNSWKPTERDSSTDPEPVSESEGDSSGVPKWHKYLLGAQGIISIEPPKDFYDENDGKRYEPTSWALENDRNPVDNHSQTDFDTSDLPQSAVESLGQACQETEVQPKEIHTENIAIPQRTLKTSTSEDKIPPQNTKEVNKPSGCRRSKIPTLRS